MEQESRGADRRGEEVNDCCERCTFYRFYPIHSPCSYIILQPESLQIRIKQHHGIFLSFYF